MDPEEAFAEEAQEEILLSRDGLPERDSNGKSNVQTEEIEDSGSEDETSPLVNPRQRRPRRTPYTTARSSYERAVNEPWTGAQGSFSLPWYKRPSVRPRHGHHGDDK